MEYKEIRANCLLDELIDQMVLKNDAELARKLEVAPPVISKIRHGKLPIGPAMLLRMHDASGFSVQSLRDFAGIKPYVSK